MRCKSETKRQAILAAARAVFQEAGFEAASMAGITARAGGSKATLYSYFTSKDELFVEVMREAAKDLMRNIFDALDPAADLAVTLDEFGRRFLATLCRPELICAHRNAFAEAGKSEVGRLFYACGPREGLLALSRFLQECMARGKLRAEDPTVAAQHLVGLLKAESQERLLFGVQDSLPAAAIPPIVTRAVTAFLRAYAPDPV